VGIEALPVVAANTLTFAAGSGALAAPFTLTGAYISQAVQTTVPTNGGSAVFTFTLTNAGSYVIQALVNASSDSANSFYVNIDAQPQDPTMIWDIMPVTSGFESRLVSWRGNGSDTANEFIPKIFSLAAGTHQLIIRGRESNTQLQSVSILALPPSPKNFRLLTAR